MYWASKRGTSTICKATHSSSPIVSPCVQQDTGTCISVRSIAAFRQLLYGQFLHSVLRLTFAASAGGPVFAAGTCRLSITKSFRRQRVATLARFRKLSTTGRAFEFCAAYAINKAVKTFILPEALVGTRDCGFPNGSLARMCHHPTYGCQTFCPSSACLNLFFLSQVWIIILLQ